MKNFFKIIFYNLLIFFVFILVVELFFGQWLKNNFSQKINSQRNISKLYEFNFLNHSGNSLYQRDNNGFRVNGKKIPREIDLVFIGGSTVNEKFKNYENTIVGVYEKNLRKNNLNINVVNAGVDGISIDGHINSFKYWFNKIEGFKPKFYIYYIGLNDSVLYGSDGRSAIKRNADFLEEDGFILKLKYYITANSFFIINYKNLIFFFNEKFKLNLKINKVNTKVYGERGEEDKKSFTTWSNQYLKKTTILKSHEYYQMERYYKSRLNSLIENVIKKNGIPILITQIGGHGVTKNLFRINNIIIEFCEKNKINCFNLAKDLETKIVYEDFYDWAHTTISGSEKISNYIFSKTKDIIMMR